MQGVYLRGVEVSASLTWEEGDTDSFVLAVSRLALLRGETRLWLVYDCPADAPDAVIDEADTVAIWIGTPPDPALARGRHVDMVRFRGAEQN